MNYSLSPFAPENLVSRDRSGNPIPRQPAYLHTQADSVAYFTGFLPSSAAASIYYRYILCTECNSTDWGMLRRSRSDF